MTIFFFAKIAWKATSPREKNSEKAKNFCAQRHYRKNFCPKNQKFSFFRKNDFSDLVVKQRLKTVSEPLDVTVKSFGQKTENFYWFWKISQFLNFQVAILVK